MPQDVLLYVEHEGGEPKRIALELATKASELASALGGQVHAVAVGGRAAGVAETLGRYGVDVLHVNQDSVFDDFLSDPHVAVLHDLVNSLQPVATLFPDTLEGRDISSRLAARADSGLVSAVVDLVSNNAAVEARETIFGGNYITSVDVRGSTMPAYLVRPNAFRPVESPREIQVEQIAYSPSDDVKRAKKGQTTQEEGAPTPLEEANIIVSGGRGLGGPEPFGLLEQLAQALGGSVGASRAAVDAGWIAYSHQVGQTGRTVKPQLYLAIGISGAVQHRVGMQTADTVVAINKDADAPIFQLADLGVVGDLFQIVPALTKEIQRRKGV